MNDTADLGTPLCGAALNGHAEIVRLPLGGGADDMNCQESALEYAAVGGRVAIVRLHRGASPNAGIVAGGLLPATLSDCRIPENRQANCCLLIENGADVNGCHPEQGSALAIAYGLEDLVLLMLEREADANSFAGRKVYFGTCLWIAERSGSSRVV